MSDQPKKQRKMLSSYSIVFLFLIFTAILTWFVPQSVVVNDHGTKKIIYDAIMVKGKVVAGQGLQPMGLWDIIMAPAKGFVKAAQLCFALLMAGAFLHLLNYVGAMRAGIGWLLKRFTGKTLIVVRGTHLFLRPVRCRLRPVGRNPRLLHGGGAPVRPGRL